MRFFDLLGATEIEPDSVCNLTSHIAWSVMFGVSIAGFDPRTARDSNRILVWGTNPPHSAPKLNAIGVVEALEGADRFMTVFCRNTNPLASGADQGRLRRAMAREDLFTAAVECFVKDTADSADIVRLAASFPEFVDITISYVTPVIGVQRKGPRSDWRLPFQNGDFPPAFQKNGF